MTQLDLDALLELEAKAAPGPWQVWDGPRYVGGGADLCIGEGKTWLANMEHRSCQAADAHAEIYFSDKCTPQNESMICSLDEEITAEQQANAALIVAARNNLKSLIEKIRQLEIDVHFLRGVAEEQSATIEGRAHTLKPGYYSNCAEKEGKE